MMNTVNASRSSGAALRATALSIAVIAVMAAALLAAGALLWTQPVHAESNFVIEDYDIEMQVNEDDTYLITETIDVHFTAPSHGIYRVIPNKQRLDRDGQVDNFYAKVKDFEVLSGQPFDEEKGDDGYYIKIGDSDEYADEDTTYQLSYVFDMRGDHLDGADEVYYNLVGTTWEAQSIDHVTAKITFPKPIDMSKVGLKTGYQEDVPFTPKGDKTVLVDTTENCLGGLTIRAVLPQGYFTKQAWKSNLLFYILIAILAAVTAFGFFLWRKYGKDPDIIETEEFYPPEGMNSAEVAYLDTGEIEGSHVTSMLLELADKGYLRIKEIEVPYGLKKKKTKISYEIIKVKEYDGDSPDEETFMEGLFDVDETSVEMEDLQNSFYETVKEIKSNIMERYSGQLWDSKAEGVATSLRIVAILGMIALFLISKILNGSPIFVGHGDFIFYIVIGILQIALPIAGFTGIAAWINKPQKKVGKFILGFIGWAALILLSFGMAVLFDTCMGAQIVPYLIGMGMVFLLILMAALCERMSDDYAEMLGKIRGYKRFLQVAEKDRMEMLAEQDPNYYYKNLAFAFALGVTAVYAKRFADLAKEPPKWYDSRYYAVGMGPHTAFDSVSMMDSMNNMMDSVGTSMTSSPSSGGGGGSFSGGGGAGGGGGGSW